MLKLEERKDAINQERLTDLKFLLAKRFDVYSEKLINAAFTGKHKILRALLHGSHEFIDFSHVLANDDAIVNIHKNHHAIFHVYVEYWKLPSFASPYCLLWYTDLMVSINSTKASCLSLTLLFFMK